MMKSLSGEYFSSESSGPSASDLDYQTIQNYSFILLQFFGYKKETHFRLFFCYIYGLVKDMFYCFYLINEVVLANRQLSIKQLKSFLFYLSLQGHGGTGPFSIGQWGRSRVKHLQIKSLSHVNYALTNSHLRQI